MIAHNNNQKVLYVILSFLFLSGCFISFFAQANKNEFTLELKDHLFYPAEIHIPANKKVKLVIYNRDNTPEEFDSFDLNREKVIFPQRKAVIFVGPLPAGRYDFFGEYNPHTAKGVVVVGSSSKVKNFNKENKKKKENNEVTDVN